MDAEAAILGLTAIAIVGIVAVVAIAFGRRFRGKVTDQALDLEVGKDAEDGARD